MGNKKCSVKIIIFISCLIVVGIFAVGSPDGNKTLNISEPVNKNLPDNNSITDNPIPASSPKIHTFTFLVAGQDKVSGSTDTIMLVSLDISKKKVNILNIPRDTMLDTDRQSKKINASYNIGGVEQFEKDVASLTGFYVNRYVLFDIEGIEKIIDAIGGVDFDIPVNMNYEDPTQDLYIHFKKGPKHLEGKDAVKVARFRNYPDGDIGRIAVQQELMKALAKQALKYESKYKLARVPAAFSVSTAKVGDEA